MTSYARDKRELLSTLHLKDDPKREKHIDEAQDESKRCPRFGLFSHIIPNCIGEDTYSRRACSAVQPRNIMTNPGKKGNYGKGLFKNQPFCSINDFYRDPFRMKQQYLKEKVDMIPHSKPFKPSDSRKSLGLPWWSYIPPDYQKEGKRPAKNVYTNPPKNGYGDATVGHLFSRHAHSIDPYENKKNKELQDQINEKKKILSNKAYCSTGHPSAVFTSDKQTYEINNDPKKVQPRNSVPQYPPFRPANPPKRVNQQIFYQEKGYNKTINMFPTYTENPPELTKTKQDFLKKSSKNPPWKPNSQGTFSQPNVALTTYNVKLATSNQQKKINF